MIDFLSIWLHPGIALVLVMIANVGMMAMVLVILIDTWLKNRPCWQSLSMTAIAIYMGAFDPGHSNDVNAFSMGDNRFNFNVICISVISLIRLTLYYAEIKIFIRNYRKR